MSGYFTKREQIVILIITLIPISLLGFSLAKKEIDSKAKFQEELNIISTMEERQSLDSENSSEILEKESFQIMIHISGAVESPGLVYLKNGDRLIDAVDIAGGLKSDADVNKINLARRLVDEERIHIPRLGEENIFMEGAGSQTDNIFENTSNVNSKSSLIDINNCTREELISLPGIGEVTADKIIEYRTGNRFSKREDIMNVSGIGDKKYQGIKDLIIVR